MSAQTGPLDVEERSEELLRQLSYATKNIRELAEQHHENISTLWSSRPMRVDQTGVKMTGLRPSLPLILWKVMESCSASSQSPVSVLTCQPEERREG